MGYIPFNSAPPPDSSLTISGKAADAKVVGDKINLLDNSINSLGSQLEKLKTIKTNDDGWVCLTLECGIKICYFKGRYGET